MSEGLFDRRLMRLDFSAFLTAEQGSRIVEVDVMQVACDGTTAGPERRSRSSQPEPGSDHLTPARPVFYELERY